MPFVDCGQEDRDQEGLCPQGDQQRALSFYPMFGGGF